MLRASGWLAIALLWLTPAPLQAASFVVANTNDSGAGSLRDAIDQANADGEPSTISFAAGLAGQSVNLVTPLPVLSDPQTSIDGDFGADCTPDFGIRGGAVGSGGPGLRLDGGGHNVRGLAISGFVNDATMRIHSDDNVVSCNRLGTNLAGGGPTSGDAGVSISGGSDNQIGPGNIIENNGGDGVRVTEFSAPGFPEMTGLTPDLVATFDQIAFDDGNLGFRRIGGPLLLDGLGRPFTENFVLRLRGTLSVSQAGGYNFSANPLDDQLRLRVGGTTVIEGNGPGPLNGSTTLSAGTHAFVLEFAEYGGFGAITLAINGPGATSFTTDGQALCPTGQPGLCGELFQMRVPAERNRITQNRIANNGGLGINLKCCGGPLENDPGDIDIGANAWLNRPQLTAVLAAGGGAYTLSGSAPANATVEVFEAIVDPSGSGESGSLRASFSASGDGSFNTPIVLSANPGVLTATATDALGNTSEFAVNLPYGGSDVVSVGSAAGVVAGATTTIPIRVRDLSLTPLGVDRGSGQRIQGLAFRVDFPVAAVTNASIVPAGITAALTPSFGPLSNYAPGTVNYLVAYNEASNPIPFNLDAAAPGDLVAHLQLTVHPGQSPGSFALTLGAATELSNQAGTIAENSANGTLTLVAGSLQSVGNGPTGLYARAQSASAVRLTWTDPQAVETGFRVQRSTDGNTWTNVQDLGPDATSHVAGGLAAATLYFWRVLTLVGPDVGGASNRASASTHPTTATQVCVDPFAVSRRWARSPHAVHHGSGWTLVWHDRTDGTREQIFLQRLDDATLAPLGAPSQLSNVATTAQFPAVGWNGTRYAVTWLESLRGAPGTSPASSLQFMRVEADGTPRRGPRPLETQTLGFLGPNEIVRPHWDGSHWGVFMPELAPGPQFALRFRRLDDDGNTVVGPAVVHASSTHFVFDVEAAWQPLSGEHGVVWLSQRDDAYQLLFQRVEESDGSTQLGSPAVVASWTEWGSSAGTSLVADPAGGWLAAWIQCDAVDCPVYTRRISAAGVPDAGGAVRITDPGFVEFRPRLARRAGGFAVYVDLFPQQELGRYLLDAAGQRIGPPEQVSTFDSRASGRSRLASDGNRVLAAWSESLTTLEVAGRLAAADNSLGPVVGFTSGHDSGNTSAVFVPGQPRIAALHGGFVALWQEFIGGSNILAGRLYATDGAVLANYLPFSATGTSNRPGLVGVGASFAVAWRAPGGLLRFTVRGNDDAVLVAEATLATGVGNGSVELGWDGEQYAILYAQSGSFRHLRVDAAGVPQGTPQPLALGTIVPSGVVRMEWLGEGWALAWRDAESGALVYARIAADGAVLQAPVVFAPAIAPFGAATDLSIAFDGSELGVAWSGFVGADPPGNELHFAVVGRAGNLAFPPVQLEPGGLSTTPPQLHVAADGFRLVYLADNDFTVGLRELRLQRVAGGVNIAGSRFLANRGSTSIATVHDGNVLAMAWRAPAAQDIHLQTDACLADPSPPPCPALTLAAANNAVRLAWPPVVDPQSGILGYHLYRDGKLIAELPASATQYDDSGHDTAVVHSYRVDALNRAFQPSAACPLLSFSTTVGDANGNGTLEVADIFYLINFLLASGPAPTGDADANGDGIVSVGDIFFIINYFFSGGPLPTAVDGR